MMTLFEDLESIVQQGLHHKLKPEQVEEKLSDTLRQADQLDSFIGQYLLANIFDAVIMCAEDVEE